MYNFFYTFFIEKIYGYKNGIYQSVQALLKIHHGYIHLNESDNDLLDVENISKTYINRFKPQF